MYFWMEYFLIIILLYQTIDATITTLSLDEEWIDDFASDTYGPSKDTKDPIGWNGWSKKALITSQINEYHGSFKNGKSTIVLYRYFDIETYGELTISLDYIFACKPTTFSQMNIFLNGIQSETYSFDETAADIEFINDPLVTDPCAITDAEDHAWSKHITFSTITEPNAEYLIEITPDFSNNEEYILIANIQLNLAPICDLSSYNPSSQILEDYLAHVTDTECRELLQDELDGLIVSEMEEKYEINILSTRTENDYDDNYFGITPISPQDIIASDLIDITEDDLNIIVDVFDATLTKILSSDDSDLCPTLHNIYGNIADLQRRLLLTNDATDVMIEKDSFCSYTNRVTPDESSDGTYSITIDDTIINIPYTMINVGRESWSEYDMDSVDITIMCIDHILFDDCNDITSDREVQTFGDYAINIDIYVDPQTENIPFTFTLPTLDEYEETICGWVENIGDEWNHDGCNTIIADDSITCECYHQTVFSLIEDLRSGLQFQYTDVYIAFLVVYAILALAATYLVVILYRIKEIKNLASIIVSVITIQIYFHVIQYLYLSFAELQSIPLGITYCVISLPLLCHFWVCSLLILHWLKLFECAKTFSASNQLLDYGMITMNLCISVVFIGLLIAAMTVNEDRLSTVVAASNGVLGTIGILICVAWFYFGFKASTVLMKSAKHIKDSCGAALAEALTLRRRLLRLTFIIGLCFFTQSVIAILSIIEHLQLFGDNFVNFATIWAVCDILIFATFILFYKTHVLRQQHLYLIEQKEREMERDAKRRRRDMSSKRSEATNHVDEYRTSGIFRRFTALHLPQLSMLTINFNPKPRASATFTEKSEEKAANESKISVKINVNIPTFAEDTAKSGEMTPSPSLSNDALTFDTLPSFRISMSQRSSVDDSHLGRNSNIFLKNRTRNVLRVDSSDKQRSHSSTASRTRSLRSKSTTEPPKSTKHSKKKSKTKLVMERYKKNKVRTPNFSPRRKKKSAKHVRIKSDVAKKKKMQSKDDSDAVRKKQKLKSDAKRARSRSKTMTPRKEHKKSTKKVKKKKCDDNKVKDEKKKARRTRTLSSISPNKSEQKRKLKRKYKSKSPRNNSKAKQKTKALLRKNNSTTSSDKQRKAKKKKRKSGD